MTRHSLGGMGGQSYRTGSGSAPQPWAYVGGDKVTDKVTVQAQGHHGGDKVTVQVQGPHHGERAWERQETCEHINSCNFINLGNISNIVRYL